MTDQPVPAEPTAEEISEQKAVRLAKRDRLLENGEAYPVSVPITTTISAVRAQYSEIETDTATGDIVGLAGRLVHSRIGGKLCFAALQAGDGERIQVMSPSLRSAKSRSTSGRPSLTSETTSSSRARSSRAAAASSRSSSRSGRSQRRRSFRCRTCTPS